MITVIDCCPLCGSNKSKPTVHPLYCECLSCKVVYQCKEIHQIEDYYDKTQAPPNCINQSKTYRSYLKVVDHFIDLKKPQSIIDVGAADGTFLNLVHELYPGGRTFAIEHSEQAKTVLRKQGIALLEVTDLVDVKSKCIFSFQVLEHISEPIEFINSLHLAPGDYLILTSPAVDSVFFARNQSHWRSYSPSYHLLLYSKTSLKYLLDQCHLALLYYDFCYSRSHTYNRITSYIQHIKNQLIWTGSVCAHGYSPRPWYHGRSSFLAIAQKNQ